MHEDLLDRLVVSVDYFNHRICTPSWEIEDSHTDFVDVTYVVKGAADYWIEGNHYRVSAGDLLCIPKGSRRSAVSDPDDLMECYSVNGKVYDMLQGSVEIPMPLPLIATIGPQHDIIALYRDLKATWLLRDPGYKLRTRGIFLMILQRYFQLIVFERTHGVYDKRIQKTLQYIIDHYDEPLTVEGMSEMVGLSKLYFGTFFKQETGLSFRQYLMSIRLNHAENMLHSGEYKVNEVARACGFSDSFYFSKVFKENRGVNPSHLLRAEKGNEDRAE
ncbi:AraC family transcriptional regulator [Eubacteriales bacterium OttesenSCG-928-A19]|nr:AraC family transcriptional regulator [Eubacteriales bacterium OttesenSCG-928-A19]